MAKPTSPGYYWLCQVGQKGQIVKVERLSPCGGKPETEMPLVVYYFNEEDCDSVEDIKGNLLGPITEPFGVENP